MADQPQTVYVEQHAENGPMMAWREGEQPERLDLTAYTRAAPKVKALNFVRVGTAVVRAETPAGDLFAVCMDEDDCHAWREATQDRFEKIVKGALE